MKLLRNPVVVMLLALVAIALLFYRTAWPLIQRRQTTRSAQPSVLQQAAHAAARALNLAPTNAAGVKAGAETGRSTNTIQAAALRTNAPAWTEAPRRDPFQSRPNPRNQVGAYPHAMEFLTLNGVWCQTDSKLAVINSRLLSVGEKISQHIGQEMVDYEILDIAPDRVFVKGPNGREEVAFRGPDAPTNAAPAAPAPTQP